jgi:hypothetical protein
VAQPLPLPQGVPNSAIGERAAMPMRMMRSLNAPAPPPSGSGLGGMRAVAKDINAAQGGGGALRGSELRLLVVDLQAAALGELQPLLAALDGRLQEIGKACADKEGRLDVRLVVGRSGMVVRVEIVKPTNDAFESCLADKLAGLTSGTRATAETGTLTLSLRVLRVF